jgi:uncharacterized protein YdiU (UPF0061 family)
MYLGEIVPREGASRWELQLKGAGPTPFSRTSDGRKVLRSSIREFLASEAMHFLGVPTTRAATCVTSASRVMRDVYYNGNGKLEPCAVVSRVARTFLRLGSFEICRPRDPETGREGPSARAADAPAAEGAEPLVTELIDYVATSGWMPAVGAAGPSGSQARAQALLDEVAENTAELLARWQAVGFVHGVLNTDNMSILSDTIDYGPYGFVGHVSKLYVPNHSDSGGRYSYEAQPAAVAWNVRKFGETLALSGAIDPSLAAERMGRFDALYDSALVTQFRRKLALTPSPGESGGRQAGGPSFESDDRGLVEALLGAMDRTGADMTLGFLALGHLPAAVHGAVLAGEQQPSSAPPVLAELERTLRRLIQTTTSLDKARLLARTSLPERAIEQLAAIASAEPARLAMYGVSLDTVEFALRQLALKGSVKALRTDAAKREQDEAVWRAWLAQYVERLALESRGHAADASLADRQRDMAGSNPTFVLREHLLQHAIALAERGDYAAVNQLLERAQQPYASAPIDDAAWSELVASLPSEEALEFVLT